MLHFVKTKIRLFFKIVPEQVSSIKEPTASVTPTQSCYSNPVQASYIFRND